MLLRVYMPDNVIDIKLLCKLLDFIRWNLCRYID